MIVPPSLIHSTQQSSVQLIRRGRGRWIQQSHALLLLPLLRHLILQLGQLLGQILNQDLRIIQCRLDTFQLNLLPIPVHRSQRHGTQPWEPVQHRLLHHRVHITLGARELGGILDLDQDDKVQVVPHVVLALDVLLKAHGLVVKCRSIQSTYETRIPQDQLLLLLLTPQISKGINDHTKDQIQNDNDDHEEEEQVIDDTGNEQWFLERQYQLNSSCTANTPFPL